MSRKKSPHKTLYTIYEARTHFSELLKRVMAGEEITIAHRTKEVAKLVPLRPAPAERQPGSARGQFITREDFDDPLPPDLLASFLGHGELNE